MPREIKFRIWNPVLEEMSYICKQDYLGFTGVIHTYDGCKESVWMESTGLKDKNGKEIYEGDILVCSKYIGGNFVDYCYERGYVEFVHGAFGLHRKEGFYRPFKDWLEDYELEVTGNIWENGDLLK